MSFFLVSGLGSRAYSAKLFAGTKQRFSGFSQQRQCGEMVLRMFVTGGPPILGGGGMPQRISTISSASSPALRITGLAQAHDVGRRAATAQRLAAVTASQGRFDRCGTSALQETLAVILRSG